MADDFLIYFWDRPIDKVQPWFAAFARSMDLDIQRGVFRTEQVYAQFEVDASTEVPVLRSMDQILSEGGTEVDCFTMRLLQAENSDGICILESSIPIADTEADFDQVGKHCGAHRFSFQYSEFRRAPFCIGFDIHRSNVVIRSVMGHGQDNNPRNGRWMFIENGTSQPWENLESYKNTSRRDRLTRQHLVDYMLALGLDYEAYAKRCFVRVLEFRRNTLGEGMSQYDDTARMLATEFEHYMADVEASFE